MYGSVSEADICAQIHVALDGERDEFVGLHKVAARLQVRPAKERTFSVVVVDAPLERIGVVGPLARGGRLGRRQGRGGGVALERSRHGDVEDPPDMSLGVDAGDVGAFLASTLWCLGIPPSVLLLG